MQFNALFRTISVPSRPNSPVGPSIKGTALGGLVGELHTMIKNAMVRGAVYKAQRELKKAIPNMIKAVEIYKKNNTNTMSMGTIVSVLFQESATPDPTGTRHFMFHSIYIFPAGKDMNESYRRYWQYPPAHNIPGGWRLVSKQFWVKYTDLLKYQEAQKKRKG